MAKMLSVPSQPAVEVPASEKKVSGGHLVAKALRSEGVDTIFTLCGGHIIDIYDGCIDEGIKIIDVRHEQVAAHAADGYARMTGNLGCAVVTAGPGTTNAITGVANAFRAESPMLLIGGQAGACTAPDGWAARSAARRDAATDHQIRNVVCARRCASRTLFRWPRVRPLMARLVQSTWRFPATILDHEIDPERAVIPQAGHYRASAKSLGDPERHPAARRCLVVVDEAVRAARAAGLDVPRHRRRPASSSRALNIPAYMNGAGRGTLPPDHPLNFQLTRRDAFEEADVIVIVGTPFDFRLRYGKSLRSKTVVQIDMSYATVGRNRDVDLGTRRQRRYDSRCADASRRRGHRV